MNEGTGNEDENGRKQDRELEGKQEGHEDLLARIFHSLRHRYDHLPAGDSYDGGNQGICGLSPDVPASALGPWIVYSLHTGYRAECETSGLARCQVPLSTERAEVGFAPSLNPGEERGVKSIALTAEPAFARAHPLPLLLRGLFHRCTESNQSIMAPAAFLSDQDSCGRVHCLDSARAPAPTVFWHPPADPDGPTQCRVHSAPPHGQG